MRKYDKCAGNFYSLTSIIQTFYGVIVCFDPEFYETKDILENLIAVS